MSFCFMIKKGHFKQKLLIWLQVPFNVDVPYLSIHIDDPLFYNPDYHGYYLYYTSIHQEVLPQEAIL